MMTPFEIYFLITLVLQCLAFIGCVLTDAYEDNGFSWLNPLFIYKHASVNWFGALFIALLANVALPVIAIVYWMYKLCTVGRR